MRVGDIGIEKGRAAARRARASSAFAECVRAGTIFFAAELTKFSAEHTWVRLLLWSKSLPDAARALAGQPCAPARREVSGGRRRRERRGPSARGCPTRTRHSRRTPVLRLVRSGAAACALGRSDALTRDALYDAVQHTVYNTPVMMAAVVSSWSANAQNVQVSSRGAARAGMTDALANSFRR
jgi:hypothetical protein